MAFLPDLYVPESGKTQAWCEQVLRACAQYSIKSTAFRNERIKDFKNYDMIKGTYDLKDFDYITNQFGVVTPARLVHYPWMNTKIDTIVGEFLSTPFEFGATLTNDDGKERKLDRAARVGAEMLTKQFRQPVEQSVGQPLSDESVGSQSPDDASDLLNMSGKDEIEEFVQLAVKYLIDRHDMQNEFKRGLYDSCITCKEFYYVDIINGEPIVKRCDPRSIIYDIDTTAEDLEDAAWVAQERFLTPNQIVDEFREYFQDATELEELKNLTQAQIGEIIESNPQYGSMYHINQQGGVRIRVIHGCWNALKQYKVLVVPNEYDPNDPIIKRIPDDYKPRTRDVIQKRYYNDVWEGIMIGPSKFIKCQRRCNQPRRQEWGYAKTKLPYIGSIKNGIDGLTISLVDSMFNLQLLYDVVMFHIDLTLSRAAGKAVMYDISQKPKQYTFSEVIAFAKNSGLIPIDTSKESGRSSAFNQFQQVDFTLSSQITQLVNLKQEIERTSDEITGISRVRQGKMQASDGAHNTMTSLQQSNTITMPLFYIHNRVMNRVLNQVADLIKYSKWKQGDRLSHIMDDGLMKVIPVPNDSDLDDIGIFLKVGTIERDKLAKIVQLAEQALSTKSVDFGSVVKIVLSDSSFEAQRVLEKGLAVVKQQQMEMMTYQRQLDAEQVQAKAQSGNGSIEVAKIRAMSDVATANIKAGVDTQLASIDQELQQDLVTVKGKQQLDQMAFDALNQDISQGQQPATPVSGE